MLDFIRQSLGVRAFVSAQEVRSCERASRARPRMREMFFSFSFPWEGQQKDPETTSTTHPGARLLLTKKMAGSLRTYYSTTTQEPYTCQTFQSWPTCILCIYSQLLMHAWKLSKICAFWVVAHKCAFTCLPHQSNFHVRGKHDTRWTFPMFHELIISICIHIYMRLVTERSNQRWTWNVFIFMF